MTRPNVVLEPFLTECPSCPNWQIPCTTEEEKQQTEDRHAHFKHAGVMTSAAVADLLYGDPKHTREKDVVEECIREDARAHNGSVDQNRVRERVPSWVNPRVVSATYSVLIRRGVLHPHGQTKSNDRKGRNNGKPVTTYLYRGPL